LEIDPKVPITKRIISLAFNLSQKAVSEKKKKKMYSTLAVILLPILTLTTRTTAQTATSYLFFSLNSTYSPNPSPSTPISITLSVSSGAFFPSSTMHCLGTNSASSFPVANLPVSCQAGFSASVEWQSADEDPYVSYNNGVVTNSWTLGPLVPGTQPCEAVGGQMACEYFLEWTPTWSKDVGLGMGEKEEEAQ